MTTPNSKGKGKGKATALASPSTHLEPDENVPLLDESTSERPIQVRPPRTRSNLRHYFTTFILVLLSVALSALLFLILLGYSFKPSSSEIASLPKTAFRYTLPESVSVLDVNDYGIWLNVTVNCGIDYDQAMGTRDVGEMKGLEREEAEMRGDRGLSSRWWERIRRWAAHRGLDYMDMKAVEVEILREIKVFQSGNTTQPLLSAKISEPILIPLIPNLPARTSNPVKGSSGLRPVSFDVWAKPIASTGELWELAQSTWASGEVKVKVEVWKVVGRIPGLPLGGDFSAYNLAMDINIPGE